MVVFDEELFFGYVINLYLFNNGMLIWVIYVVDVVGKIVYYEIVLDVSYELNYVVVLDVLK